ncbi:MAG: TIGR01841 family phasin [Candidatus Symbiobacter sp.]|nr:TIGR01841 family phasin [Candidatus Symbiobacter sp.]
MTTTTNKAQSALGTSEKIVSNALDFNALIDAQKRNVEAFNKAAKVISDSTRDLFTRQAALVQQSLSEGASVFQDVISSRDIQVALQKQLAYSQNLAQKASAASKESVEIGIKGANDAFSVLRARAEEGVTELNSLVKAAA